MNTSVDRFSARKWAYIDYWSI